MPRVRAQRLASASLDLLLNLTQRHIHAQLVDRRLGRVVIAVHTTEPAVKQRIVASEGGDVRRVGRHYATATVHAAGVVGEELAKRVRDKGIDVVYWNRPGKYHGKIKAFIDRVRQGGVQTRTKQTWDQPQT